MADAIFLVQVTPLGSLHVRIGQSPAVHDRIRDSILIVPRMSRETYVIRPSPRTDVRNERSVQHHIHGATRDEQVAVHQSHSGKGFTKAEFVSVKYMCLLAVFIYRGKSSKTRKVVGG